MSGEIARKPSITHRRKNSTLGAGSNSSSSPPIANIKPIPNYLKASVSSCHDACKYGHKHGSESNWRPPVRPKKTGNCGMRGVVLNPELCVSGKKERLKRDVIEGNISPPKEDIFVDKEATFVESATFGAPIDKIDIEMLEEVFELSDTSSLREIKVSGEEPSVNSSPVRSQDVPDLFAEELSEVSLSRKVVVSHFDGMHTSEGELAAEITPSKDESVKMVERAKNVKATRINGSDFHNGKREIVMKKIERENVDKVSLKPNATRKRDTVPKNGTVIKADASIQPRPRMKKVTPLANKPRLSNNGKQSDFVNPPSKSLGNLKKYKGPISPPEKSQNRIGGSISNAENTSEKTIYMIETKQEVAPGRNLVKKGSQKGKLSSASSSSTSEKDHTGNKKVVSWSHTMSPVSPHKMAFCRGKVVDVQAETNVPTRIKFRHVKPGNMINKGEEGTGVNKVARKKRDGGAFAITGSTPPPRTPVVLRHQDSPQDKNGAAVSFNHVIEETASKLAETRKSKVKALVGAFETVISLQEKSTISSS